MWSSKSEGEIVNIYVGDNDHNEALVVVTKEGEIVYVPRSDLSGVGIASTWREERVVDVLYAVCSGTHVRMGKSSPIRKLAGLEVLLQIVFEFLFTRGVDGVRNVWSTCAAVSTLASSSV